MKLSVQIMEKVAFSSFKQEEKHSKCEKVGRLCEHESRWCAANRNNKWVESKRDRDGSELMGISILFFSLKDPHVTWLAWNEVIIRLISKQQFTYLRNTFSKFFFASFSSISCDQYHQLYFNFSLLFSHFTYLLPVFIYHLFLSCLRSETRRPSGAMWQGRQWLRGVVDFNGWWCDKTPTIQFTLTHFSLCLVRRKINFSFILHGSFSAVDTRCRISGERTWTWR